MTEHGQKMILGAVGGFRGFLELAEFLGGLSACRNISQNANGSDKLEGSIEGGPIRDSRTRRAHASSSKAEP